MSESRIVCPHCQREVELTDALLAPLLERLRSDVSRQTQEKELELLKQKSALEDRAQGLELEVARRMDAERQEIRASTQKALAEDYRLKEAENQKLLEDMKRQMEDLRRKVERGSEQARGEVLEMDFEGLLRSRFPHDRIEPVAKGVHGADLAQRVHTPGGVPCGTILWETKRTKNWSETWLPKLRDDQRAASAEVAVLATLALPSDVATFTQRDGVWITSLSCADALAAALRSNLIALADARRAAEGQQGKMEEVYRYLTGPAFRRRVEGIAEAFTQLRSDLEKEKAAFQRMWAAREQQLRRVIDQTAGLYGDVQGIAGAEAPQIPALEP